jgi:hypothetical protein
MNMAQSNDPNKPDACPKCGSKKFYGLPMFNEELERRLSTGEIVLGGCCVCEDDPIWQCLECQQSFGHRTDSV